jgi:membrane protein YqaA with SNARE-associated domain
VREFFSGLFAAFLSPWGVVVLAALDSSMIFFLPGAVDIAVILLAARQRGLFFLFPLLAAAGSVIGSFITFLIGARIGEHSLERWVSPRKLKAIEKRVRDKGAFALALPGLMPPPFPLTPFVLVCGALKVRRTTFFLTLASARLLRYGVAALLALAYGERITGWLDSPAFKTVVTVLFLLAIAGTALSLFRLTRKIR